ncbi:tetratricopeptide repeat protein [Sphingomonas sp.]|uniref:tetratricopeptide repeat protein n=1 Tax=Sphingomonas sp. TaxID=28214 RepID=UPI0035BC2FBD
MMMRMGLAAFTVVMAVPGLAQASDRTATGAIVTGDYASAERVLVAERRIFPARPELMLNLATVYRQTGRESEAQALYADVLRRPDVLMDMPDQRTMSSHALAQVGLQRLTQVAAR